MGQGKATRLGPLQTLELLRGFVERATGIKPTPGAAIQALVDTPGWRIPVSPSKVEHLYRENAQQELINGCVRWSMRTLGPQASYTEAFKVYLDHAKKRELKPLSLKTFKNRALDAYGEDVIAPTNIVPLHPYAVVKALFLDEAVS